MAFSQYSFGSHHDKDFPSLRAVLRRCKDGVFDVSVHKKGKGALIIIRPNPSISIYCDFADYVVAQRFVARRASNWNLIVSLANKSNVLWSKPWA